MDSARMSLRNWLVPTVAGVAGLAVGFLIARAGGEAGPVATFADSSAPSAPPLRETTSHFTLDDVRRVVREELDARGVAGGAAGGVPATPAAAVPDPAQSAAASRASSTLEAALSRRSWTEQDSESLRDDFAGMAPEQRAEWLRQFSVAVNQGRLVPENERSPF